MEAYDIHGCHWGFRGIYDNTCILFCIRSGIYITLAGFEQGDRVYIQRRLAFQQTGESMNDCTFYPYNLSLNRPHLHIFRGVDEWK